MCMDFRDYRCRCVTLQNIFSVFLFIGKHKKSSETMREQSKKNIGKKTNVSNVVFLSSVHIKKIKKQRALFKWHITNEGNGQIIFNFQLNICNCITHPRWLYIRFNTNNSHLLQSNLEALKLRRVSLVHLSFTCTAHTLQRQSKIVETRHNMHRNRRRKKHDRMNTAMHKTTFTTYVTWPFHIIVFLCTELCVRCA